MSKCLALGPGGMGIFSILGSLKSIEERLDLFQEISGSSAGAIVALFLGIGLTVDQIFERLMKVDTNVFTRSVSLKNILSMYGGVSPTLCKDLLRELCGDIDPTFDELVKKIYISSYSLERSQTVYFSRDTHPKMKVIDAVYMSASIPFVFACENMHVDGGMCERIPMIPFLHRKNEEVYIIEINSTTEKNIKSFVNFAVSVVRTLMNNRVDYPQFTNRTRITIGTSQIAEFSMSTEDKLSLYIKGFKENIISL